MISVYCRLIIAKKRMFDTVPENLKAQVRERLFEMGYDTDGDPISKED